MPETAKPGVADRVAQALLDMIAGGTLLPGERLPGERELARRMHASRSSVRAALQRLKTQGLLAAVQGGGTRVVSSAAAMDGALTTMVRSKMDNLRDLAEIRLALETWAARRAAQRARPEDLGEIEACLDAMAAASRSRDAPDRALADAAFHLAIGKAADSPVYTHLLSVIRGVLVDMFDFHRNDLFRSPEDDAAVMEQHRAIYRAIAAHDPPAAEAAMARHLKWVLRHYEAARRRPAAE